MSAIKFIVVTIDQNSALKQPVGRKIPVQNLGWTSHAPGAEKAVRITSECSVIIYYIVSEGFCPLIASFLAAGRGHSQPIRIQQDVIS